MSQPTESKIRSLRADIYGDVDDESWSKVRENWMRPDSIDYLLKNKPSWPRPVKKRELPVDSQIPLE